MSKDPALPEANRKMLPVPVWRGNPPPRHSSPTRVVTTLLHQHAMRQPAARQQQQRSRTIHALRADARRVPGGLLYVPAMGALWRGRLSCMDEDGSRAGPSRRPPAGCMAGCCACCPRPCSPPAWPPTSAALRPPLCAPPPSSPSSSSLLAAGPFAIRSSIESQTPTTGASQSDATIARTPLQRRVREACVPFFVASTLCGLARHYAASSLSGRSLARTSLRMRH